MRPTTPQANTVRELPTVVEMVGWRMLKHPDRIAYRFLGDGERETGQASFRDIEARTRAIAARLQESAARGDRILLVYAPGIEFVCGFLACLYAGMVAVPIYPPEPMRLAKTLPRFRAVIADARCAIALSTSDITPLVTALGPQAPEAAALTWIATDTVDLAAGARWLDPWSGDDDIAMLQYTSGSTAAPKGVVITHRNLLHNQRLIRVVADHGEDTIVVGWLPPYHDMGLIGMLLQPLYLGATCVFMPPFAFLKKPLLWLKAISKYRATTSPAPNFAFDLCSRKVKPEDLVGLDLSTWSVAFNGAEPVRKETLERFYATFERCGLERTTILPCYGLAEATLIVTGVPRGLAPTYLSVDTAALAGGRAVPVDEGTPGATTLVSAGRPLGDTKLVVVSPEGAPVPDGTVGELWLKGGSIARGYFERDEETARTFGARLPDGRGPFLRSGDLGFVLDDDVYIVGRLKDLIIVRGRNVYPQDLELASEQASPGVRPGCVAAFGVDVDGEERVVIVAEVDPSRAPAADVRKALIAATSRLFDLQLHDAVVIGAGTIPKTTSGKIQRSACRAAYVAGQLERLAGTP